MIAAPVGAVRARENGSYSRPIWYFLAGSVVSGSLLGLFCGLVGLVGTRWISGFHVFVAVLTAGLGLVGILQEVGGRSPKLPSCHWQVPRGWNVFGADVFATLFGFSLGVGFLTHVTFVGYYVMIGLVVLQGSLAKGVAVLVAFAIGRSLPLLHFVFTEHPVPSGDYRDLTSGLRSRFSVASDWIIDARIAALVGGAMISIKYLSST